MARKAVWPPKARPHANGQDRVRWAGEDHYLGKTGSPEAAENYEALLERLARERHGPPPPAAGPTVEAALVPWCEEVLPTLEKRNRYRYARALTVLARVCGDMPAAEFDAGDLDRVRAAMRSGSWLLPAERGRHGLGESKGGKGGGPWSASNANRYVVCVRTVWRWLELRKLVPRGSWGGLRTLRALPVPCRARRDWVTADVVRVAMAIRRSPVRLMLLVQLWSGCRSGEARGMRWDEIDTSGRCWVWRPSLHKNAWRGHARVVVLGPRARAVLAMQRRREPRSALVFPCRHRGEPTGRGYTASAYSRVVAMAAARAGLAGMTPYACRHSAKDRFARAGGIAWAAAALGHASTATTDGYGTRHDLDLATRAALRAG